MSTLRQLAPDATDGVFWSVTDHLAQRWTEDPAAWDRMTPEQRTVVVLGMLRQDVMTGGFERYFRYDSGNSAPLALDAVRLLPPAFRRVLGDAVRVLGLPYPVDPWAREEALDAALDRDPFTLDVVDEAWRALERDHACDGILDAWVWAHRAAFFDD